MVEKIIQKVVAIWRYHFFIYLSIKFIDVYYVSGSILDSRKAERSFWSLEKN